MGTNKKKQILHIIFGQFEALITVSWDYRVSSFYIAQYFLRTIFIDSYYLPSLHT